MTALPTILAGLYIYAVWILTLGKQKSGLAAALGVSLRTVKRRWVAAKVHLAEALGRDFAF